MAREDILVAVIKVKEFINGCLIDFDPTVKEGSESKYNRLQFSFMVEE